jgi:glycosyltransferase involved in cell wall biosynthesis
MKCTDVTIVIPISLMADRLGGLLEILDQVIAEGAEVILIHDFQDEATSIQLTEISNQRMNSGALHLIEGRYGGPGLARNAGLQVATRKYVVFWDSDDLVYVPNFIEFIGEVLEENSDVGIAEFVSKKNETYRRFHILGESFSDAFRFLAIYPGLWRYVFKRETIEGLKFIESRMGEDQVFIAQALKCAKTILLFHKPVYEYQVSGEGQLTSDPKNLVYLISSLQEISKIHRLIVEPEKRDFLTLMYWKMYITLITKNGSGISKVQILRELVSLRKANSRLLVRFLLQFTIFQNYKSLK